MNQTNNVPAYQRQTNLRSVAGDREEPASVRTIPDAILTSIDGLTPSDLDRLPFGAIQLDQIGTILRFNEYEANLSNRRAPETVGKNFFKDVAPCTDVKEFHGRFREGLERGEMQVTFPFIFRFPKKSRRVDVTLYHSQQTKTVWVFVIEKS